MSEDTLKKRRREDTRSSSELPMPSGSAAMQTYYDWLRKTVGDTQYGEVGLYFVVHQGNVTRVKKHVEVSEKT